MKAIRLHKVDGPKSLRHEETPKPIPKDNQVLVQVYATAITPTEFDWYPTFHTPEGGRRPFPIILGHEFSGVVEAAGSGCTGVQVGDPIYGLSDWFTEGAQAEFCVTVPADIAPKPVTLDHTQAATVPISALTAWQALVDRAHLSGGQRVLIHGAAGGVGSFAVQLARHQKAHVTATASAANTDFVKTLGADDVIDYRMTPFETVVGEVDVVLDTVGGDTRDRSWSVLRKGGRLVTIAADAEGSQEQRVREAFFIDLIKVDKRSNLKAEQLAPLTDASVYAESTVNGASSRLLTPQNSALILIDHQPQMAFATHSIDTLSLINNVTGLAKAAKIFKVPTILTTVASKSFSGPLFPTVQAVLPDQKPID